MNVVAHCEIDKAAQKVLARHFPDAKLFEDVTTLTGKELLDAGFDPANGIITGGFPCQDLSVAGKRAGLTRADGTHTRSGLFWHIVRLLEETKTRYFILENVPGLLSSNGGEDFAAVLAALVELRYGVAYRVLNAEHFGVPQRRRRIFIVGCLGDDGSAPAQILAIGEGRERYLAQGEQKRKATTGDAKAGVGVGFTSSSFGGYEEGVGTLRANGGDLGGRQPVCRREQIGGARAEGRRARMISRRG